MDLAVRIRGRSGAAAMLALGALGLVACSSSTKATSVTAASSATTKPSAPSGGSGGSDQASQIAALTASVQAAEHGTFKAVYTSSSGGTSDTVTIEQKSPKSVFASKGGSVINDGTKTYFCSVSSGPATCVTSTASTNPFAALIQLYSPAAAISVFQQAQTQIAARVSGYNVTFSSQTFAGQASTCVNINGQGNAGKYCVTKSGILAYEGTATSNFQLTSFSSVVSDSDFSLPAGASVVTLPGGG
jgi:hypothetical protein